MNPLPHSLTSVRVFDAVARNLSCSRAAEELFITQSAVSKQLKTLEEYFGVPLFARLHQGLAITEAGQCYWDAIRPALEILREATIKMRSFQPDSTSLSLGVPATLGQKWIIPRLTDFKEKFPWIDIHLTPRSVNESQPTAMDAEIRYGRGTWPGMTSYYLLGRVLYPICSIAESKRISFSSNADMLKHTLIEHIQLPHAWEKWFASENITGFDSRKTQKYEQFSIIIPALLADLGVALMPRFLVEEELKKKKLTVISKHAIESDSGYYLVYPKGRKLSPTLTHFTEWLLENAKTALV